MAGDMYIYLSQYAAHKRPLKQVRREEPAGRARPHKESTPWEEESDTSADEREHQQMLKDVEAKCLEMVALNIQWSSSKAADEITRTSRRPTEPPLKKKTSRLAREDGSMEGIVQTLLKECEALGRRLKTLE
ncbi:hypothetical protein BGZ72_010539, partial [Mortierella alpina]